MYSRSGVGSLHRFQNGLWRDDGEIPDGFDIVRDIDPAAVRYRSSCRCVPMIDYGPRGGLGTSCGQRHMHAMPKYGEPKGHTAMRATFRFIQSGIQQSRQSSFTMVGRVICA